MDSRSRSAAPRPRPPIESGMATDCVPTWCPEATTNPVLGGPDHYFDETQFAPVTAGFFGTARPQYPDHAGIGDVRPGLLEGVPGFRRPTIDPVPVLRSSTCSTARTSAPPTPASSITAGRRIRTSVGSPARGRPPDRSSWACASCSDPAASTLTMSFPQRGAIPPPASSHDSRARELPTRSRTLCCRRRRLCSHWLEISYSAS